MPELRSTRMRQAITDQKFGAWALKCNPKKWDLKSFIDAGGTSIESWSVQENYRSNRMKPGDPVILWVSGSESADLRSGIWGVGYVTAPINEEFAFDETFDAVEEPADDETIDEDYWLDTEMRDRVRFFINVDLPLLVSPISRDLVRATPGLADMELLRQPQMSNPSWLTKDEWAALQQLLGENALEPADPADLADWTREAEIQQPDPHIRRIVERAAVRYVIKSLQSDEWQIEDVQAEKVGWDLTVRRNKVTRYVEVKGRALQQRVVQLTANEIRAAREQTGWELAVVTGALNSPNLTWNTAENVTAVAVPVTFRAILS